MTELLVNPENCGMFGTKGKVDIVVKASSIENADPKKGLTLSSRRLQAPKMRGKLARQNAQAEDSVDWDLDLGYGSSFSSSVSSHSDYGSFDWSRERDTPSDVSDGKLEYQDDSGQKLFLDIPSSGRSMKQISQASSGYWGDSEDLEVELDILNLSSASSVFSESETQPEWEKDCEQLLQQLSRRVNQRNGSTDPASDAGLGKSITGSSACTGMRLKIPMGKADGNLEEEEVLLQISEACSMDDKFVTGPSASTDGSLEEEVHLEFSEAGSIDDKFVTGPSDSTDNPCSLVENPPEEDPTATTFVSAHLCHHRKVKKVTSDRCTANCSVTKVLLLNMDLCFHYGKLPNCDRCRDMLCLALDHSSDCTESSCSLPFCQFITGRRRNLGRYLSLEELKGEVSTFGKLSLMEGISSSVHSLPDQYSENHAAPSREVLPFLFLGNFGKFNVLLARMIKRDASSTISSTVVIKQLNKRRNLLPALKQLQSLRCKNLASVLDVMEKESHFLVITDYAPGMSFQEVLDTKFDWQCQFGEVISALSFLHQHNILFLNWELDNIICSQPTRLLVSQGSLTLIPDGATSVAADDVLVKSVSPRIAAPEILKASEVNNATDIWGLGALLYQMLTGSKPYSKFRHFTPARARDVIFQKREPPCLPDGTEDPANIVHQCCSWNPDDRPSLDFVKDLLKGYVRR